MEATEDSLLLRRWSALPRAVRAAFVCCFAAGFLTHLFAITNLIPNSDGVSRVFDPQQMTVSGRWFLHYATMWNGYLQAPALIGFFTLLFLSLAAALTASLLGVRSPVTGGLIGAAMAVFPSVAYTFLYLFTASAYSFGILLAVLAVWLSLRRPWGFLWAAPLLACALGTYQAYLAVAASLCLMALVLEGLEPERGGKRLLLSGLKQLAFLLLGLALYYGILRVFLAVKELELLSYKGIAGMGEKLSPGALLAQAGTAYAEFFRYFFVPHSFASYTTPPAAVCGGLLALAGLWALARLLRRGRWGKRPGALALTLLFLALLPLAMNLTVLMGEAMPIMRYALVFAWVLAFALTERAARDSASREGERPKGKPAGQKPARLARLPLRLAALAGVLLLGISAYVDNMAYTVSATAHRATESFATRLVERVESTPGYRGDMEVVIIGGFPSGVYRSQIEAFSMVTDYSNLSSSVIPLNKHVYYYLNDWLNVPWPEPEESVLKAVSDSQAFRDMPLYPSDGSIRVQGDRVIVKLASKYTPKKDYEIAYENRR